MQSDIHKKFILSPIINILRDSVTACKGVGCGIETQSLGEYVLQTTFLKMTGASEQKLKCICWEIATNDYDYRYLYLKKNYGECSSYTDKNNIYNDLIKLIVEQSPAFSTNRLFDDVNLNEKTDELIEFLLKENQEKIEKNKKRKLTDEETQKLAEEIETKFKNKGLSERERAKFSRILLFEEIQDRLMRIVGNTLIVQWDQRNYLNYIKAWKTLSNGNFAIDKMLFDKDLENFYTRVVYSHRNRCAHNLISYQNNLPTLKTLTEDGFVYDNYYFRFSMLILLDEIFIRLYKACVKTVEQEYWT